MKEKRENINGMFISLINNRISQEYHKSYTQMYRWNTYIYIIIVIDNVCACMFWPLFKSSAILGKNDRREKVGR